MNDEKHKHQLVSSIKSIDDVKAFTDEELSSKLADHEMGIVKITGIIDLMYSASDLSKTCRKMMQIQRILKMHKGWIANEIASRLAKKKEASRLAHNAFMREAKKAKDERIKISNEETLRNVAVFRAVALEVMGREMYEHIWQLANERIARGKA